LSYGLRVVNRSKSKGTGPKMACIPVFFGGAVANPITAQRLLATLHEREGPAAIAAS